MLEKTVAVQLPESIYRRLQQAAKLTYRSVDEVLVSTIETNLPTLQQGLPPELQEELAAMHLFSDAALQAAVEPSFSPSEQTHLAQINQMASTRPRGGGVGWAVRCEYDAEAQRLIYHHTADQPEHTITLTRKHGPAEVLAGPIQTSSGESYPLEHEFIRTNGVTLHVVLAGPKDGEPVLLLHGFPEFWYGWKYQIPYLVRRGYRVIVPDQRGYNLSDKPQKVADYGLDKLAADAVGLLDALGYEQAYLVGHDWGGAVAWWLAMNFASRFKKVAVLNAPHPAVFRRHVQKSLDQQMKSWYMGFFQIPWLNEALASATDWQLGEMMLRKSGLPDTFTAEDIAQYRAAWARPGAMRGMLNWYRAIVQVPPRTADPLVRVPLLLVWGAQDVALGREMALPSVRDLCVDGRVVFIEEATHWVQHDEPERVNGYLGRFFEG